jgi:uncharacterized protein
MASKHGARRSFKAKIPIPFEPTIVLIAGSLYSRRSFLLTLAQEIPIAVRGQAKSGGYRIGVISDTHGLLRPEALEAFCGSNHIIHAGDVGAPEIIEKLALIAPVTAIRGNVDKQPWARQLAETEIVHTAGISIYVLHDLSQLDLKPEAAGVHVVISGHSHVPRQETRHGVLYFNPGSAGPRRFRLPISVGRLIVERNQVWAEIIPIEPKRSS